MNLAVPTLLVIAALIPGITFVNSYYAGRFTRELAALSPVAEIALFFFWAVALDATAFWFMRGSVSSDTIQLVVRMAMDKTSANDVIPFCEKLAHFGWLQLVLAFVMTVLASTLLGTLIRRLVWASRADVYLPLLRMKNEWFYVLQARLPGFSRLMVPVADVLVSHPDENSRLYVGIVAGFESADDGRIDQLLLRAAHRMHGRGADATLRDIPGALFTVMGSTIHSINMRYHKRAELGLDQPMTRSDLIWAHVSAMWRSFWFEEP